MSTRTGRGASAARPLRALIADDEPRARQYLEKLLGEHESVEVVGTARGGAEALQRVGELKPDVAFLDIHMPDLSGLEVARHLRGADAPIVVFVTAYDKYAIEAFEVAALDYLLKPLKRERLAETVAEMNIQDVSLVSNVRHYEALVHTREALRAVLDGIGGINTRQFRPDPARRAEAPLRVLLNGRRSRPKKGTDIVLRALAGLAGRVPDFEVVLFDSLGPQNRQDPRDGAPLPANARFVLDPTQEELVALYQSAHLFVAAERKAGWCNTALEAMACGVAVVCTPSGTRDFARHGGNALVARWRHPWALRPPIARLLRDPALRQRLGAAGPATAAAWTWEALAAKLLAQLGR